MDSSGRFVVPNADAEGMISKWLRYPILIFFSRYLIHLSSLYNPFLRNFAPYRSGEELFIISKCKKLHVSRCFIYAILVSYGSPFIPTVLAVELFTWFCWRYNHFYAFAFRSASSFTKSRPYKSSSSSRTCLIPYPMCISFAPNL